MASASVTEVQPVHRGKFVSWLAEVFQLNPAGVNWARGVLFLDIALVPLVFFWAIGHEVYLLSALFGALFAWLADPGGSYGLRVSRVAIFAAIGAGLTALAFGIGGDAWGWLVLAASVVTLVAGLAVMFGVRRFVNAVLLNIWFIIALGLAFGFHHSSHHITQYTWAQTLAWAGGAALWIVVSFIAWLISGRQDQPQPIAEIPGDTSRRKLPPPVVMFAVLRAVVVAGTTAIAFGANPSHGLWLVVAAIIAMKPSLEQSTVTALQRLAGALQAAARVPGGACGGVGGQGWSSSRRALAGALGRAEADLPPGVGVVGSMISGAMPMWPGVRLPAAQANGMGRWHRVRDSLD